MKLFTAVFNTLHLCPIKAAETSKANESCMDTATKGAKPAPQSDNSVSNSKYVVTSYVQPTGQTRRHMHVRN